MLSQFFSNVGVSGKWKMNDVYGLDDELLATVPRLVLALLLLFPLNDKVIYMHYFSLKSCLLGY